MQKISASGGRDVQNTTKLLIMILNTLYFQSRRKREKIWMYYANNKAPLITPGFGIGGGLYCLLAGGEIFGDFFFEIFLISQNRVFLQKQSPP